MIMLNSTQISQFDNLLNKLTNEEEFEIMFNNYKTDNKLSIIKFMNILKYIKLLNKNKNINLKHESILDIIFDYEQNNVYRISITGIKNINDFLNLVHQRSNHVLFLILLTQSEFLNNPNFSYINKKKILIILLILINMISELENQLKKNYLKLILKN